MRIFGLNAKIIRVLLATEYAHMLEYRAEIALWALSGILPFIMLSIWNGSDARVLLGMDGVGLDRYFLSAFLVRQFSVVWMVYALKRMLSLADCLHIFFSHSIRSGDMSQVILASSSRVCLLLRPSPRFSF